MKKIDFYPFDVERDKLREKDLLKLKSIPENWFVEYKEKIVDLKKISKEICAFANQNGGYIFFGISEESNRVMKELIGIPPAQLQSGINNIELSATTHCSPSVKVDIESIGLENGNFVLMVSVPKGNQAPYLHSSGAIYRRQNDQSLPVQNQQDIEELQKRGQKHNEKKYLKLTSKTALPDHNPPFAFINLLPVDELVFDIPIDPKKIYKLAQEVDETKCSLPFDRAEFIAKGIRLSQRINNVPSNPTYSINLFYDGHCRIDIPLNHVTLDSFSYLHEQYDHENVSSFINECLSQKLDKKTKVIDYSYYIHAATSGIKSYMHLANKLGITKDFRVNYELVNIGYSIPFINSQNYINQCKTRGLPFTFENEIKNLISNESDSLASIASSKELLESNGHEFLKGEQFNENYIIKINEQAQLIAGLSLVSSFFALFGYDCHETMVTDIYTADVTKTEKENLNA